MSNKKEYTIYDLARKLNVSPATISRGLKDHPSISKNTKKKIRDLAEELGYRSNTFASNLRRQKTDTIGVIVPRLNSNFMSSALAGMERAASEQGYHLIICQSLEQAKKEIENTSNLYNRVDGLIASLAYDTDNTAHFDPFIKKGIPVVFFDRVSGNEECTRIVIDNSKAAFEATVHLIDQGCRNIIHITGNTKRNVYADRLKGYKKALVKHGILYREKNIIINDLSIQAGLEAGGKILKMKPLPDGIFAANDTCAASCMKVLKQNGLRIPQDIAIVGFNNDPVTGLIEPNMSTVDYRGYEMGEKAAGRLISHLTGRGSLQAMKTVILNSSLIIRDSSLKKRAGGSVSANNQIV